LNAHRQRDRSTVADELECSQQAEPDVGNASCCPHTLGLVRSSNPRGRAQTRRPVREPTSRSNEQALRNDLLPALAVTEARP
jgi:hypothetical protein